VWLDLFSTGNISSFPPYLVDELSPPPAIAFRSDYLRVTGAAPTTSSPLLGGFGIEENAVVPG